MLNHEEAIRNLVKAALKEDVGPGDLTSLACLEPDMVHAHIVAKSDGVLSGLKPALLTFAMVDSANHITPLFSDGQSFTAGDVLIEMDGLNRSLLASERVVLNFLAHLSGVATMTKRFVDKIAGSNCRILDTRKTTPGWRVFEKEAVVHGGGDNHRYGLYDMVLIKDNHIAAVGSITSAVEHVREFLNTVDFRLQFGMKAEDVTIEVEVTTPQQLEEAIQIGVRRLLLDNQSVTSLKSLVTLARTLNPEVKLEASGGVSLDTVADIAATGVDYISVGALTHSAPAVDLSMRIIE